MFIIEEKTFYFILRKFMTKKKPHNLTFDIHVDIDGEFVLKFRCVLGEDLHSEFNPHTHLIHQERTLLFFFGVNENKLALNRLDLASIVKDQPQVEVVKETMVPL